MAITIGFWLFYLSVFGMLILSVSRVGMVLFSKILPHFQRVRAVTQVRKKIQLSTPAPDEISEEEKEVSEKTLQDVPLSNEEAVTEDVEEKTSQKSSEKKDVVPQEIYTLLHRAEALISRKEYEEAKRMLIKILSWDDDHAGANEHLAFVYLQTGEYSRAENIFRKVIETRPRDPSLLTNFALSVFHQNKSSEEMDESLLALRRAAEIDSKNPVRFANLGQSLFSAGDIVSAAESFEKALRFSPRNIEYLFFLADSYLMLERFAEAKQVFSKILDISPLNEDARREHEELRKKGF
ncbi:tetratricopeptide repeat protein [Candidatus Peregrinibacteria bacterium]|nr:MAG: tetratricopeptide repeat protein [Candidatus Peregrinibacteria bacterium]